MSDVAEAYRQRARVVAARYADNSDRKLRAISQTLVEAYEQLARNEEWLAGEIPPHIDRPPPPARSHA